MSEAADRPPRGPRISVLIPALRPDWLGQAIASVLAQTVDDYELLVSDDSADGAVRRVVERFRDPRIRLLEGPRRGLVANSELLWDAAAGELVKFVYDDDFLMPFCLARLLGALEAYPRAGFAFVRRHRLGISGRLLTEELSPQPDQLYSPRIADQLMREQANSIGEPTCVLARRRLGSGRLLSEYAGFRIRHLVDVAFYLNALGRAGCVGVSSRQAVFREHAGQATGWSNPARAAGVYEWELFLRGELAAGRLRPASAIEGADRILGKYRYGVERMPALRYFSDGLQALRDALARGETPQPLDHRFRAAWTAADAELERSAG